MFWMQFAMSSCMQLLQHHVTTLSCFEYDLPCQVTYTYCYVTSLYYHVLNFALSYYMWIFNVMSSHHHVLNMNCHAILNVIRTFYVTSLSCSEFDLPCNVACKHCHIMSFRYFALNTIYYVMMHVIIAMSCHSVILFWI